MWPLILLGKPLKFDMRAMCNRSYHLFLSSLLRWFMPINVGLTFLFGGILGWIAVKLLKPKPHLEGLIIATCASGNCADRESFSSFFAFGNTTLNPH